MQHEQTNGHNRELHKHTHGAREGQIETHLGRIGHELKAGFEFVAKYPKSVTIFGSSLAKPDNTNYAIAEKLAARIVDELGYSVITGGGPGIMEAANKGAFEMQHSGHDHSAGLSISLPHEHNSNPFTSDSMKFSYFFTRKALLTFAAEAFIFFPGGFGTFDELFSILTLVQTSKIPSVPILLYDTKFWGAFKDFLQVTMIEKYATIDTKDLELFETTDSIDTILERIKKAPVSEWWRNIN